MDFALTQEQRMIYEYGDRISKQFDHNYWRGYADKNESPTELYQQITNDGFLGIMVPEAYGGAGQGMTEMLLFMEGLANNGIPLLNLVVGPTMTMGLLAKHASEDMKRRFLPGGCSGDIKFCFAITEPNAGSNSIEITSIAKSDGQGRFKLNGQKVYITDANCADYAMVVTRTTARADVKKKTDGFTIFMVDMKKKGISKTLIPIAFPVPETQWQLFFDNVELTEADVLGEVGKGFNILFDTLNPERIILSGLCTGVGRFALKKAVAYANDRKVFNNTPIGAYQGVQHPLAIARCEIEMASLMALKAAWAFDQGLPAGEFSNIAKYAGAEAGIHAVDAAIQTHGGNGFTKEYGIYDLYGLVRLLRTAPLNRELVLNYIAEHVMGLPRSY
ncbi:MAG: acyl-CoA/acyl-ACP dehydrogenase [Gammaproteobacteria bacterium]|uniref:acyl-CoA dehydrogenase family protein n=1 Tax=Hydrogenophaga sp. TaxID=1904254 RepID=UPI0025C27EC0|nr:acyl-CoA dehydrogenase family protein [Hydrogenophaga sp.]MBU4182486.1 acyl-CoA/acyl-ACP dehydrogenase [Gammaproteobacteria bacterium]MCG2656122.1 acyl-CoA/acyl-ACP dehydrogenase [Hydrogenophaga sp.]